MSGRPGTAGPRTAAVGRTLKPLCGSRTGCLGDERTLDTDVLGRSYYKFHIKKMRKPGLPGATRMLIHSGLGPRQCFHVGGSGLSCQGGTETQALRPTWRSCLLALFREEKMPNICMARTVISLCDVGQAKSWPLEVSTGWQVARPGTRGHRAGPAVALGPPPSVPSSARRRR